MEDRNLKIIEKVCRYHKAAKERQQPWLPSWEKVAKYVLPEAKGFAADTISVDGPTDTSHIYDSTGRISIRASANSLYSYTIHPSIRWYEPVIPYIQKPKGSRVTYKDIMDNGDVQLYLEVLRKTHMRHLNRALSPIAKRLFMEFMSFAKSGVILNELDSETGTGAVMAAKHVPLKDLYVLEGQDNETTFFYRKLHLDSKEAEAEFGFENLSKAVQDKITNGTGATDKLEYGHCVFKRDLYDIDLTMKDSKNMKWASIYIDMPNKHIVRESGYEERPFGVAGLGPGYSNSPALDCLPNIVSLNKLSSQQLEAGDRAFGAALNVPKGVYLGPLNTNPYALNYYDPSEAIGGNLAHPVNTGLSQYQIGKDVIAEQTKKVKEGLYDLIMTEITGQDNVFGQQNEMNRQLLMMSPFNAPMEEDLLRPLLIRSKNILARKKLLPEMPKELEEYLAGADLEISFTNPLARAAKLMEMQGADRLLQVTGNLAQLGAMDEVNIPRTIRIYQDLTGAPIDMLNTKTEKQAILKSRQDVAKAQQEAAKEQSQIQNADTAASALNKYSAAMSKGKVAQ